MTDLTKTAAYSKNPMRDEAILFSITDRPLKESLGFYWEESRAD